jgi:hypothetical protein
MSNPAVQHRTAPAISSGGAASEERMATHAQTGAKARAAPR